MLRWLLVLMLLTLAGCDVYTAQTRQDFNLRAVNARSIANAAARGELSPADNAYYLECFARTFANYAAGGNWKQPPFLTAPTNRPTTLPWVPVGGTNPAVKP